MTSICRRSTTMPSRRARRRTRLRLDERLKGLPRLLRYAMLVSDNARHIEQRLIAEIDELCPSLPLNAAWAAAPDAGTGLALAARTRPPRRHPERAQPAQPRRLRPAVVPAAAARCHLFRVTTAGSARRWSRPFTQPPVRHRAKSSAAISSGSPSAGRRCRPAPTCCRRISAAAANATSLGASMADVPHRCRQGCSPTAAEEEEGKHRKDQADERPPKLQQVASPAAEAIPDHHLVVARLSD